MIIGTMATEQIYDNFMTDQPKINFRIEYLRSKAIKELKRAKKYPAVVTYKYKNPATLNEYTIFFYAETRFRVNTPEASSFFPIFNKKQRYILTPHKALHKSAGEIRLVKGVNVYSCHFFERYNERFLKDNTLQKNDIISIYLARNKYRVFIEMNEKINRNHEKYGYEGQQGQRVRDGFCFTRIYGHGCLCKDDNSGYDVPESITTFYKTYTNESDMHISQTLAIKDGEEIRKQYYKDQFTIAERKKMVRMFSQI